MSVDNGICLYSIEKDGCLNGVYSNEYAKGKVFNEIAYKHPQAEELGNGIFSRYNGYYFDPKGTPAEINISIDSRKGQYIFEWIVDRILTFKGYGYLMNSTQLVVWYESVP